MNTSSDAFDVAIIGGGPTGATAGLLLARAGLRAVIIDKSAFPRFRIGESFLPRAYAFMRDELGLADKLAALPHVDKFGAEFAMGDTPNDNTVRFAFDGSLTPGGRTFNIERAVFDQFMLDEAAAAGVEVRTGCGVAEIVRLADRDVAIKADDGRTITARWLLDASGPQTVIARHLGTRVNATDSRLRKVAYFGHFENVERLAGTEEGHPLIVMCDEGWFWVIPISATKTSVGLVMDADIARSIDVPANRMLDWGLSRCPLLRHRMRHASGPTTNQVVADFTYRCRPYAGPGHFLLGDAAAFMDPIFSTGVCLGMMSAAEAVRQVVAIERGDAKPSRARRDYIRFVDGSTGVFFRLIRNYYRHGFRELFLNGSGPLSMHRAVLSILAGHVFPKPPWKLRWRLSLFYFCLTVQRWVPLVYRRNPFSLRATPPTAWRAEAPSLQASPGDGLRRLAEDVADVAVPASAGSR